MFARGASKCRRLPSIEDALRQYLANVSGAIGGLFCGSYRRIVSGSIRELSADYFGSYRRSVSGYRRIVLWELSADCFGKYPGAIGGLFWELSAKCFGKVSAECFGKYVATNCLVPPYSPPLGFSWIPSSDLGLFNRLRAIQ